MIGELFVLMCHLIAYLFLLIVFAAILMNIADVVKRKLTDIFGHELLNSDKNVRKAYVMKLEDDEVLKKVALGDHDEDIGVWAVDGISDYSMLEEISKSEKFCVSRAAKRKISNLE